MFKTSLIIILILLLSNIFTYWIIWDYVNLRDRVAFLNVGEGDSELIKTKAGNILIDTGPNDKILFEISKILPFYDRTIDLVIITHPNTDHFNGLFSLLNHYKIRAVIVSLIDYPASRYQKLLKELQDNKILLLKGRLGTKITFLNNSLLILSPFDNDSNININNINKLSIVTLLQINKKTMLFTADIDKAREEQLIPFLTGSIDVLKVAHHGSNTASSEKFLNSIKPKFSVIEVGENNYGHPAIEVLTRLEKISTKILRTDLNGTIQFISTPTDLQVQSEY